MSPSLCCSPQRESRISDSFVLIVKVRLRRVRSHSHFKTSSSHYERYFPCAYADCMAPPELEYACTDCNAIMSASLGLTKGFCVCMSQWGGAGPLCALYVCACLPLFAWACTNESTCAYVCTVCAPSHIPQVESAEMVDLWDEMLHISMLVKELPPSLLQSGTEEEEEMMFLSLCREMTSSVRRNTSRPRKSHT